MKTQEDLLGDNLGWINRPTDQRFSFKIFLQDYIPSFPWWRMSLSLLYGTRTPTTHPYQTDRSNQYHIPPYFRTDWGNTIQLTRFRLPQRRLLHLGGRLHQPLLRRTQLPHRPPTQHQTQRHILTNSIVVR